MQEADFTLSAGPTMSSVRVRRALGRPASFDYDPAFLERFREAKQMEAALEVLSATGQETVQT